MSQSSTSAPLIERVGEIIDRVSQAAQVVFFFTLLAGLVVLLAALEATRDERRHEAALIRTLGADNRWCGADCWSNTASWR
jgi:putative ABC transport system permease protein